MKSIFSISALALSLMILSGCSDTHFPFVYKIDIPQGNVVTDEHVEKLKVGMNPDEVSFLLGTPLLIDPFHQDQWEYIYQFTPGSDAKSEGEIPEQKLLRVYFEDGSVINYSFHEEENGKEIKEEVVKAD